MKLACEVVLNFFFFYFPFLPFIPYILAFQWVCLGSIWMGLITSSILLTTSRKDGWMDDGTYTLHTLTIPSYISLSKYVSILSYFTFSSFSCKPFYSFRTILLFLFLFPVFNFFSSELGAVWCGKGESATIYF